MVPLNAALLCEEINTLSSLLQTSLLKCSEEKTEWRQSFSSSTVFEVTDASTLPDLIHTPWLSSGGEQVELFWFRMYFFWLLNSEAGTSVLHVRYSSWEFLRVLLLTDFTAETPHFLLLFPVTCGFSKYCTRSGCLHGSVQRVWCFVSKSPSQLLEDTAFLLTFATNSRNNLRTNWFLNPKNCKLHVKEWHYLANCTFSYQATHHSGNHLERSKGLNNATQQKFFM